MQTVTAGFMLALAIVMMVICTTMVLLRLIGRRMQKLPFGADDLFIVLSWIFVIAMCVNMTTAVAYQRWGVPMTLYMRSKSNPKDIVITPSYLQSLQFQWVHELVLPLQLMFAKLSILFFYRRLLCVERRGFLHWATLATVVVTALWGVSMFFLFLFQCGPSPSVYWSPRYEDHGRCQSFWIEILMTTSDFSLDVVILLLPIRRIATLHISRRKKILVAGVFATGLLSVAASAVRIYAYEAPLTAAGASLKKTDPNLLLSTAMYWGLFEAGFAVIAACLPNVKFFVDRAVAKFAGRQQSVASARSCRDATRSPSESSYAADDLEKNTVTVVARPVSTRW